MTKIVKILSLIFSFNFSYTHGMEHQKNELKYSFYFKKKVLQQNKVVLNNLLETKSTKQENREHPKDPRLLLDLPDELLGYIITYASEAPFTLFSSTILLNRYSQVCKKFKHFSSLDTLKILLTLDQKVLDTNLYTYATYKSKRDVTPFLKLLITMGAKMTHFCDDLISCVSQTTNAYLIENFITSYDANVNQQDNEGQTPLHWAINHNKVEIVKILLKYNADIYLKDNDGKNPVDIALLYPSNAFLKILLEHGIDTTITYDIYGSKLTIAEWAEICFDEETYILVTNKKLPKKSYKKLNKTCAIS